MNRIARSTMGAFVVAGAALAAAPAWCAPDGSVIENAGGAAAENAAANPNVTENAAPDGVDNLMGNDMQSGVEHPVKHADDSAAPPAAEHAMEPAMEPAAEQAMEPAAEHAMEPAAEQAMEPAAEPAMQPAAEQASEPAAEPAMQPAAEQASEPATEPQTQPATEPATGSPAAPVPTAPAGKPADKGESQMTEGASGAAGMHMHMHHAVAPGTVHSMVQYAVPSVQLVRDDGRTVSLAKELDDGRPVILTFVYTSCTTICPMISQTLEQLQGELGADRDKVHIMSISIDPEADTPERLRTYAARFGAGPEWQHYTGTVDASVAAQRAFNVFRGDKMNHTPVTFVRAAPGQPWLRIDGFATPTELLAAYRDVLASS